MGLLVFSILVVIGLFIGLGFGFDTWMVTKRKSYSGETYEEEMSGWRWRLRMRQALCLLGLLLCLFGLFTKVSANAVGIVYSPWDGTQETTLPEGFHSKGLFDTVYEISTEVQTKKVEGLTTQTKDAQYVTSTLDIKYKVSTENAYKVFKQYRELDKMSESLIVPTTQRVLELITTKYNVMDVLGEKRADIYAELQSQLSKELEQYGVEFYSISISDMDAGEAIETAITNEAVAKKAVETAEQELLKAETEAKQKSVIANAEKEAAAIEAETKIIEAQAEKEANELLQKSLTDEILSQLWIEKWNGKTPTYYGGEGTDLIFNTGEIAKE